MTVAEWIKLWDSINISTIPFIYYYNDIRLMKYKLYEIKNPIKSIKLKCTYEDLTEHHINIYHDNINIDNFNYDQQQFYSKLHLEIPDNTNITILHMYIE